MEKTLVFNKKNKENCSCQCHFGSPLCYHIDCCCCPFLCFSHESCPNVISNSYISPDSPRIIIPSKEKEFQIKSEQRNKNPKFFNNKTPFLRNRTNNIFHSKSNTEELNNNIINNNNTKFKEGIKKETNNQKIKPLFKKIKVHKNNHERIFKIPICKTSRHKDSIDINTFLPNSTKINKKAMKFNDYELDKNKKILVNKNLNITNISPKNKKSGLIFGKKNENKFILEDKNDDILNTNCSSETNDNRAILQNIKKEIDKTKDMINNLKSENKKLKSKLNKKQKNDKDNNVDNEIDNSKNNLIKENLEEKWEKDVILLKDEIKRITDKLKEYENFIDVLKKRNEEQEIIIENKNKEILNLMIKIGNFDKSINNNEQIEKKLNNSNIEYKNLNNNLKKEILKLKQEMENKDNTIKELEIKLKFEKNYNNKKQKMLELFFKFYQNLKKVINYENSNESLQTLIDIITIDDFKNKINNVERNIIKIIEDIQIKYGHCFACDIACCTLRVDKLKTFRKKNLKK